MFCVVVCHVWLSYVNLSGTGIHKNRGALIYPCRLSSSFLHYWLLSWPSTGSTAFTEWSPLLCTTFDRSWQSTTEYIFLFLSSCLTRSDLSFHEGMNVFFSPFPQSLIPLLPLQHFLNLDSWIQLKRHIHGSDDDRAVSQLMIGWLLKPSVRWSK